MLDRTFTYPNEMDGDLENAYVELTIKMVDQDLSLCLTRHLSDPHHVMIDQRRVPVDRYFCELGETMGWIDADWSAATVACTNKDWLAILTMKTIRHELDEPGDFELDSGAGGQVPQARLDAFLRLRYEEFDRKQERNDLIKRCKALENCRNKMAKNNLMATRDGLVQFSGLLSTGCNELQSTVHDVTLDIVSDQATVYSAHQIQASEFYDFDMDRIVAGHLEMWQTMQDEWQGIETAMGEINGKQREELFSILQLESGSGLESRAFQLELAKNCLELCRLPEIRLESLSAEALHLNRWFSPTFAEYQAQQRCVEELFRSNEEQLANLNEAVAQLKEEFAQRMRTVEELNGSIK